jgi:hypothetical protein
VQRTVAGVLAGAIAALASGSPAGAQDPARFVDLKARDLFERSRAAVVHQGSLRELHSLRLRGRLRVAVGNDDVDGRTDIAILLPDHYLRVDTVGSSERRSGFAGRAPLSPTTDLRRAHAELTRLMLGAAAYAMVDQKLAVRSTGEDAFPDTAAVDVDGPSFSARLVVDAASLVPLRVVYFGEGRVSTVVSFADRRTVDGMELPFRVTTRTGERVLETLMFDEILVNPDPGRW